MFTGAVGDEAGFIVNIEGCRFDPPVRLTGGETYVIRSEYGADAENYAPAAFLGLEGVMGPDEVRLGPRMDPQQGWLGSQTYGSPSGPVGVPRIANNACDPNQP